MFTITYKRVRIYPGAMINSMTDGWIFGSACWDLNKTAPLKERATRNNAMEVPSVIKEIEAINRPDGIDNTKRQRMPVLLDNGIVHNSSAYRRASVSTLASEAVSELSNDPDLANSNSGPVSGKGARGGGKAKQRTSKSTGGRSNRGKSHKAFLSDNTATEHFVSQEVQEMVSRRYHETTAALYRELDRMKATKGGEHYNEFVFRGSYDLNQEQVDRLLSNALSNEDASTRGKILHRSDLISFCLLPPFQHDSVPAKSQLSHMKNNSSANAGVAVWEGISYDLL